MLKVTSIYDSHVPIKTIKVESIDQGSRISIFVIKKLLIEKKKLYKKYCLTPITFERQYKRIKNLVQRKTSAAKIQYLKDKLVVGNNRKQKWDVLRSVLGISTQRAHCTVSYVLTL